VRIIARSTLHRYVRSRAGRKDYSALKAALDAWNDEARRARWASSAELKSKYRTASVVAGDRIVFNIRGNRYRLVVSVDFVHGILWIKWIGTHKEYDRIDVRTVEYAKPEADSQ
jgi:mRNA interferase HigB